MVLTRRQQFTASLNNRQNNSWNTATTNLDPYTYNPRYPWFDKANYDKLEAKIDALGLTGYDKEKAMDDLYIQVLPKVQDDIKNSDRRKYINQNKYEASQIQDKSARTIANGKMGVVELTQQLKEKFNIDPSAPDEEVFNSWISSIPNGEKLLVDYLNTWNRELLYEWGLATKVKAPETKESSVWGIQSIINKQSETESDSTLWKINNALDRINLLWKTTEWVDNLVQKIPTLTYENQVKNLENKMNNLTEDEISNLYDQYLRMIKNWSDEKWKNDTRNGWELVWDAITWDKDALDRVNTLHLYDYSEAMPQDWVERNQRWSQAWDKTIKVDSNTLNKAIDASDMNDFMKASAKAWVWGVDKVKNLVNFVWWSWGWLENYAEALGVWLQQLDDISDMRTAPTKWLENNEDAFNTFVADKVANFGEYITDAPDTLLWKPVTPNAVKFMSNIPQSFVKLLSSQIRGKTNPLDTKIWLAKMLFTEEWQQAMIDRYGSVENIANTMNTDPSWLADDMIGWADKFNAVVSKASWWAVPREQMGSLADAWSDKAVNSLNQWLSNTSNWLRDKWYNRTANFVDLEKDVSMNPTKVVEDTKKIASQWAEDLKNAAVATAETVKNLPENIKNAKDNAVEWIAKRLSWAKSWQDKLFQAQEPTLNRLSKERNTKNIRNKAEVANELIVKDIQKNGWELPTDTESRVNAHQRAMDNIWKEIESWIKDKEWYMISTAPIADALDNYIKKEESYWITSNQSDLNALKEQSKALREKWFIDVSNAEWLKQRINAKINDWDDKSVWNTAKNWLRILTQEIWAMEDAVIAKIPWEFQDLKNDFGALADGYGDVLKADIKAQRAKYSDSISNYSRIKWIWDILKWVVHADIGEIGKGTAQAVWWEVTAKLKDKDRLITEWFKELAEEMNKPDFKSSKKNKAWQPKYK